MAYYTYYQQQYPGWGQQQYANQYANQAFIAPPVPSYQPQPGWTGYDFYNAHYGGGTYENDVGMFDYVWSRIKSLVGASAVGHSEARHWHHRVYGGLVDITTLLPSDLGAAAGYEAMRLFNYHKTIYRQPLMDDREREEEALAGLAIAEATKLWSYCNRPHDKYGRREACEVSAATAQRLFRRNRRRERERDRDDYRNDYDVASSYGGYDDDDMSSDEERRRRRGSRRSRRRSSAGLGYNGIGVGGTSPMIGGGGLVLPATNVTYVPTYGGSYGGGAGGGLGVGAGSYGLSTSPMMGGGLSLGAAGVGYQPAYGQQTYMTGANGGLGVAGIPAAGYAAATPVMGGGLGVPIAGRQRASSFSYNGQPSYY